MNGQIAVAAGILLAVTACATNPPADAAPPVHRGTGGTCDPTDIQQFVGQEATAETQERMKQVSGASIVRIVPPGTVITMEYSPERLTVYTDANNRVEKLGCS